MKNIKFRAGVRDKNFIYFILRHFFFAANASRPTVFGPIRFRQRGTPFRPFRRHHRRAHVQRRRSEIARVCKLWKIVRQFRRRRYLWRQRRGRNEVEHRQEGEHRQVEHTRVERELGDSQRNTFAAGVTADIVIKLVRTSQIW